MDMFRKGRIIDGLQESLHLILFIVESFTTSGYEPVSMSSRSGEELVIILRVDENREGPEEVLIMVELFSDGSDDIIPLVLRDSSSISLTSDMVDERVYGTEDIELRESTPIKFLHEKCKDVLLQVLFSSFPGE